MIQDLLTTRSILAILTWVGTLIFILYEITIPDFWIGFMGAINAWYFQSEEFRSIMKRLGK
jgi:hypothetical protein